jgi:hypothetical protein
MWGFASPRVTILDFKGHIIKITTEMDLNELKLAKIEVLHEALGASCQI